MSGEDGLAREVFFLAYHLHWAHADILGMPVPERHRYVTLLADQLRREQEAMREGSPK